VCCCTDNSADSKQWHSFWLMSRDSLGIWKASGSRTQPKNWLPTLWFSSACLSKWWNRSFIWHRCQSTHHKHYITRGVSKTFPNINNISPPTTAQQPIAGQGLLTATASRSQWVRHTTLGRTPLDKWSVRHNKISLGKSNHYYQQYSGEQDKTRQPDITAKKFRVT
jgi:hypothetical protein